MCDVKASTSTINDYSKRNMELEYEIAQERIVDFRPVPIAV
jgi:hypothetical protein